MHKREKINEEPLKMNFFLVKGRLHDKSS